MTNILVFGASNTYGCWDSEGGWVQRLRKAADQKNLSKKLFLTGDDIFVYDLGIPGDTTELLLSRVEFEAKQRDASEPGTIIIYSIGINDSLYENKTGKLNTSLNKYQSNVEKLIKIARRFTKNIIFVGPFPVDESRMDPVPWLKTHSYKNQYIKEYSQIMESVCRLNGSHFINLFEQFIGKKYQKLLLDGVHGNNPGHQAIFKAVRDYLAKNKIIDL